MKVVIVLGTVVFESTILVPKMWLDECLALSESVDCLRVFLDSDCWDWRRDAA